MFRKSPVVMLFVYDHFVLDLRHSVGWCSLQLGPIFSEVLGNGCRHPSVFLFFQIHLFFWNVGAILTVYILAIYLNCQRWHFCILLGLCWFEWYISSFSENFCHQMQRFCTSFFHSWCSFSSYSKHEEISVIYQWLLSLEFSH